MTLFSSSVDHYYILLAVAMTLFPLSCRSYSLLVVSDDIVSLSCRSYILLAVANDIISLFCRSYILLVVADDIVSLSYRSPSYSGVFCRGWSPRCWPPFCPSHACLLQTTTSLEPPRVTPHLILTCLAFWMCFWLASPRPLVCRWRSRAQVPIKSAQPWHCLSV